MATTKAAGRATTKRTTATATTGKVSPRGKGKAAKAQAPASPVAAKGRPRGKARAGAEVAPEGGWPCYDTAPTVTVSQERACNVASEAFEAGTNLVILGIARTRKPLSGRSAKRIADALKLAGESTRVRVIWNLRATGPMNVTTMCEAFGLAQPAVSHHLSLLRHSGIVEATRDGKMSSYSLTAKGEQLAEAMTGIEAAGG